MSNNDYGRPGERTIGRGTRRDRHDTADYSYHAEPSPPPKAKGSYPPGRASGVGAAENSRIDGSGGPGRYASGPDRDNVEYDRSRVFRAPGSNKGREGEQLEGYRGGDGGRDWQEKRDRSWTIGRRNSDSGGGDVPGGSQQDDGARRRVGLRRDDSREMREVERSGEARGRPGAGVARASSRDLGRGEQRSNGSTRDSRVGDRGAYTMDVTRKERRDGCGTRDERDRGTCLVGRDRAYDDGRRRRENRSGAANERVRNFGGSSGASDERERNMRRDDSRGRGGGERRDVRGRGRDIGDSGSYGGNGHGGGQSDSSRDRGRGGPREQYRHERGYGNGNGGGGARNDHGFRGGMRDDHGDSSKNLPEDGFRRYAEGTRPSLGSVGRDYGDRRRGGSRDDRSRFVGSRDGRGRIDSHDSRDRLRQPVNARREIDHREGRGANAGGPSSRGSRLEHKPSPVVGFVDGMWVGEGRSGGGSAQGSHFEKHRNDQPEALRRTTAPRPPADVAGGTRSYSGSGRPRWDKPAPGAVVKEVIAAIDRKASEHKPAAQQQKNKLVWGASKSVCGKRPLWGGGAKASGGSWTAGMRDSAAATEVSSGTPGGAECDSGVNVAEQRWQEAAAALGPVERQAKFLRLLGAKKGTADAAGPMNGNSGSSRAEAEDRIDSGEGGKSNSNINSKAANAKVMQDLEIHYQKAHRAHFGFQRGLGT